ncbi:MAG: hypothetical protein KAV82_15355 [Phycisphaerae bacterium]|nr:hypothetical protein [Phycisphaerae bacterium]
MTLLAACSSDSSVSLIITPNEIPADGRDVIKLSAEVLIRGKPSKDGREVTFSATDGSFKQFKIVKGFDVDTLGGMAAVDYYPPTTQGEVTITASTKDPNKASISDSRKLTVTGPTPVCSRHFTFQCGYKLAGAFVPSVGEIRIPCKVKTADADERKLPYAPVEFHAEAGYMDEEPVDKDNYADELRLFWYVIPANATAPANVEPINAETELGLFAGSHPYRNPRDGLATIVACTYGEEWFNDKNGNGVRNPGETFDDLGEPFLDIDDDGKYDHEQYQPLFNWFSDNNSNGVRDGSNGLWDSGVTIGRVVHILFSGEPDSHNSGWSTDAVTFCACSESIIHFSALDENFNPPAVFKTTDRIDITNNVSSNFTMDPPDDFRLRNEHNMIFSGTFNFQDPPCRFAGFVEGVGGKPAGRQWQWKFEDARTAECLDCSTDTSYCDAGDDTVAVKIRFTPSLDASQLASMVYGLSITMRDIDDPLCK